MIYVTIFLTNKFESTNQKKKGFEKGGIMYAKFFENSTTFDPPYHV